MKLWQILLQEAQTAAKKAQEIAAKNGGVLSDEDRTEYQKHYDLAVAKKVESDQAKKVDDDNALLKSLTGSDDPAPGDDESGRLEISDLQEKADRGTFGERFTKSAAYGHFRKEFPNGVGRGTPVNIGRVKVGERGEWGQSRSRGQKTLTFGQARTSPTRMPTVDMVDRDRLTLLDLIDTSGSTDGDFDYVQVTGVTRNAKIVGELTSASPVEDLKPLSDIQTALADAKVYTYADGYDVTNKLLANAPAFATYMNSELAYSLDSLIEDKLLNGSGEAGEPRGILNTTGVQEVNYTAAALEADGMPNNATVKAFIRAARVGIMGVTRKPGGTVTGICLSPEMEAAIDLLEDNDGRFYGQGPFGSGPGTLWGRPRVTSERLDTVQAILGDWKQVALLDHAGLSVLVFNQHKDYAQRNLNYVRGELEAAQVIWKPNRLAVIQPAGE